MSDQPNVYSKVLVHEHDEKALEAIKAFCDENNLIGMRDLSQDILEVLKGNIDLGAIFMAVDPGGDITKTLETAQRINQYRHEIPIFLRLVEGVDLDTESKEFKQLFAGAYNLSDLENLKELVDSYVFSMHYPASLVRGIEEISEKSLVSAFKNSELVRDHPSIVRDKTIYGEILSLIELESSWCRGYMMLQVDKPGIIDAIAQGKTGLSPDEAEVRGIDNMLSEITNLIWGGIKARFFSDNDKKESLYRVQVPIIVNHVDKYVTFGSDQPQLCIKYKLRDIDNQGSIITIYQRFVFNMVWSPELFNESEQAIDELVNTGELEMF